MPATTARCKKLEPCRQAVPTVPPSVRKWPLRRLMLQLCPDIDVSTHEDFAFRMACAKGHLPFAQHILRLCPRTDISAQGDYAFRKACMHNHLTVAQWLYRQSPSIDISHKNDFCFRYACRNNNLAMAQWLVQIGTESVNMGALSDCAFRWACAHGNVKIAQWIATTHTDVQPDALDCEAFRQAVAHQHLPVMQWLFQTWPQHCPIDPDMVHTNAIINRLDIVQWLHSHSSSLDFQTLFLASCQQRKLDNVTWCILHVPTVPRSAELDATFLEICREVYHNTSQSASYSDATTGDSVEARLVKLLENLYPEYRTTWNPDHSQLLTFYIERALDIRRVISVKVLDTCPICYSAPANLRTSCAHTFAKSAATFYLTSIIVACVPYVVSQ